MKLKSCPFCGREPEVGQRPCTEGEGSGMSLCFISCFCDGYSATAYQYGKAATAPEARSIATAAWNRRSALEQGEPKHAVLNALQVLERMDYRPGDSALVENFLAVLGRRGMWVIENPLASIPPNTPVEAGKLGVGQAPSDDEIRKVWNRTQDPIATVRAFVPSGVQASFYEVVGSQSPMDSESEG